MPRYAAVLCDLLTALVDSWALWAEVAGDAAMAARWREEQLRLVTSSGAYRPFEEIVREAARTTGVADEHASHLLERWGEVRPYPDVAPALSAVREAGIKLGIVTNCSQRLGELAAARVGAPFDAVVTAEAAGYYKPDSRAYLAGCQAVGVPPEAALFVAGSPHDLPGADGAGLDVLWANRRDRPMPPGVRPPVAVARGLEPLAAILGIA